MLQMCFTTQILNNNQNTDTIWTWVCQYSKCVIYLHSTNHTQQIPYCGSDFWSCI